MILKEKFERILTYRGRNVYDTLHSFSRFFERGLSHLRPKTYSEIIKIFQLDTNTSEKNRSFEYSLEKIKHAYPNQYRNYWNLYTHLLKKGIDKIIDDGDKIDQYIITSKKFGLGIQIEWRRDRSGKPKPQGYSATSLGPETMKWAKGDKKIFVERYKLIHPKTLFRESTDIELVFHRFDWPDELTDVMFPAYVFLENSKIFRTFQFVDV